MFKKFEKENLFQIMCAGKTMLSPYMGLHYLIFFTDIVERFQLSLMLAVIAIRNMIEMSGSEIAFLPKSFMKGKSLVDSILSVKSSSVMLAIAKLDLISACTFRDHVGDGR